MPGQHLVTLFGLTPSEARLAQMLLAGADLSESAGRDGRATNTLRTHPARLMAKTETNRRSELMRLLTNLPRTGQGT